MPMIGDPGAFREGPRSSGLIAVLERKPAPLAPNDVLRRQIQPRTGIVELPQQDAGSSRPGLGRIGHIRRVPGAQDGTLPVRSAEEIPAAAADRDRPGGRSEPAPRWPCRLCAGSQPGLGPGRGVGSGDAAWPSPAVATTSLVQGPAATRTAPAAISIRAPVRRSVAWAPQHGPIGRPEAIHRQIIDRYGARACSGLDEAQREAFRVTQLRVIPYRAS